MSRTPTVARVELPVPTAPGLGVELDPDAPEVAHEPYLEHGLGARDDAVATQYLVPGTTFDPSTPAWCAEPWRPR